jgi:hypothetical protein
MRRQIRISGAGLRYDWPTCATFRPALSSAALLGPALFGQCADRFRNRRQPTARNAQAADVGQSVRAFFNFRKRPLYTSKTHDAASHELTIELERAELLGVVLRLSGPPLLSPVTLASSASLFCAAQSKATRSLRNDLRCWSMKAASRPEFTLDMGGGSVAFWTSEPLNVFSEAAQVSSINASVPAIWR